MKKLFFVIIILLTFSEAEAKEINRNGGSFIIGSSFTHAHKAEAVRASTPEKPRHKPQKTSNDDPIEPLNRIIFAVNSVVDRFIVKPAAQIYGYCVPLWGRDRVSNVIYNLSEPATSVNSALQGDPKNAFAAFWRFAVNTIFGVLGTFDVATSINLTDHQEDLGQTFAAWGWDNSNYFVLPLFGSSTIRDGLGFAVEIVTADPVDNYVLTTKEQNIRLAVEAIDDRLDLLPLSERIDATSNDKYISYRDAYLQRRSDEIKNIEAVE